MRSSHRIGIDVKLNIFRRATGQVESRWIGSEIRILRATKFALFHEVRGIA
jgi:hypothetical protein